MNGVLTMAAAAWVVLSLGGLVLSVGIALLRPWSRARRRLNAGTAEPVSLVIPVKLLHTGFREAQGSVLRNLPAGSEIIVTAREDASPAIEAARAVFAGSDVPVRFLRSTATFAASPKVDNLAEAFDLARHDLIFMKDSNIELPPAGVTAATRALGEGVGLVCAIPRAAEATSFPAQIEAQVMNQSHGRLLLLADALGLGFGVGKIMVFRRSALRRVGGLDAVAHSVGEDSALAAVFAQHGLRTVFAGPIVTQRLGARTWHEVWERQMRWTAVRASNTKLAFAAEPLGLCVVAAVAAGVAAPLIGLPPLAGALLCLAAWFACETVLALAQGWDVPASAPAAMVARDALMVAVWCRAWVTRRVVWAGNDVPVNAPLSATPTTPVHSRSIDEKERRV